MFRVDKGCSDEERCVTTAERVAVLVERQGDPVASAAGVLVDVRCRFRSPIIGRCDSCVETPTSWPSTTSRPHRRWPAHRVDAVSESLILNVEWPEDLEPATVPFAGRTVTVLQRHGLYDDPSGFNALTVSRSSRVVEDRSHNDYQSPHGRPRSNPEPPCRVTAP